MIFYKVQTWIPAVIVLLTCSPGIAQRSGNLGASVQLLQPVGDFSSIQGDRAGRAGLGPGVCLEIDLPVLPLFNWMTTVSLFANPYIGNEYAGVRPVRFLQRYYYRGVDVFSGLRLSRNVGDGGELFAFAQIGMRRISAPNFEGVASDTRWTKELVRYQFSPISNLGGCVGVGLIINTTFSITLRYASTGIYEFKGLMEVNDTGVWDENVDLLSTSNATASLSFGINFRYE